MTYDRGVEIINEGSHFIDDNFLTVNINTPYSNWPINIEEKTAYTGSTYRPRPAYTYYEITHGYDEKLGKPRKLENIIKTVLKAIETLKAGDERQKAEFKRTTDKKEAVLNLLGESFVVEEERKYSTHSSRNKRRSWIETRYGNKHLSARGIGDGKFKVVVMPILTANQINKLNEFMKTL